MKKIIYFLLVLIISSIWFSYAQMFWPFVCDDSSCDWHQAWYNRSIDKDIKKFESCEKTLYTSNSDSFYEWCIFALDEKYWNDIGKRDYLLSKFDSNIFLWWIKNDLPNYQIWYETQKFNDKDFWHKRFFDNNSNSICRNNSDYSICNNILRYIIKKNNSTEYCSELSNKFISYSSDNYEEKIRNALLSAPKNWFIDGCVEFINNKAKLSIIDMNWLYTISDVKEDITNKFIYYLFYFNYIYLFLFPFHFIYSSYSIIYKKPMYYSSLNDYFWWWTIFMLFYKKNNSERIIFLISSLFGSMIFLFIAPYLFIKLFSYILEISPVDNDYTYYSIMIYLFGALIRFILDIFINYYFNKSVVKNFDNWSTLIQYCGWYSVLNSNWKVIFDDIYDKVEYCNWYYLIYNNKENNKKLNSQNKGEYYNLVDIDWNNFIIKDFDNIFTPSRFYDNHDEFKYWMQKIKFSENGPDYYFFCDGISFSKILDNDDNIKKLYYKNITNIPNTDNKFKFKRWAIEKDFSKNELFINFFVCDADFTEFQIITDFEWNIIFYSHVLYKETFYNDDSYY